MAFIYDLTDTWNAGGTTFSAIKMNVTDTASAAASKLITVQVGGAEKFGVRKDGQGYFAGNVGIGTTSPLGQLEVANETASDNQDLQAFFTTRGTGSGSDVILNLVCENTTTGETFINFGDSAATDAGQLRYNHNGDSMEFRTNSAERLRITSSGSVGIGTSSPSEKLTVAVADATQAAQFRGATGYLRVRPYVDATIGAMIDATNTAESAYSPLTLTGSTLQLNGNNGTGVRIDSSGNVGIGVTPSAWAAGNFVGLQVGLGASIAGRAGAGTEDQIYISANAYNDGSWKYIGTGAATNYYQDNGEHVWRTAASGTAGGTISFTERMRIDSSGRVGIGTSAPQNYGKFAVVGGNAVVSQDGSTLITMRGNAGGSSVGSYNATGSYLAFQTNPNGGGEAERMRIDSAGNVGIGTSSPDARLRVNGATKIGEGAASNTAKLMVNTVAGAAAGIQLFQDATESWIIQNPASSTALTFANSNAERMRIDGIGNVGIGTSSPGAKLTVIGAASKLYVDLSGDNYYDAANHVFRNFAGSEAMRIDSSGNLLVGTTSVSTTSSTGVKILPTANGASGPQVAVVTAASGSSTSSLSIYSTGASAFRFYVDDAGTIFATNTSISAISDIRLKENVRDLDAGLDTILALKPRRFDWKEGKGKDICDDMGFIAQEVEEVLPELIGAWKAGEGEPDDLKSVKAGDLIPVLVKAIQQLTARVAQLEG